MQTVVEFINNCEGNRRGILMYFHDLLTVEMQLEAKISYRIPFYYGNKNICYLNPVKGDGIELAFIRGNEIVGDQGLLNQKNRKQIRGIELFDLNEIPFETINEIIREAIALDQKKNTGS